MEISKESINNQDANKINPYKLNQYKQSEEKLKSTIYIDKNEELKVILGDSYLKNYIQTGRLEKSFAILTDRRVYMRGKCYEKKGLFGLRKHNVNRVLDVQDITETEYRCINLTWLNVLKKLVASVLVIFDLILMTKVVDEYLVAFCMFIALIGLAILILKIRTTYEFLTISFNGGKLTYDCNIYTTTEVEDFQRQMRLAKDRKVSKQETAATIQPIALDNMDKIKKLKELKELLDSRVITEQEFEKLKSEVMGNN